MKRSDITSRKLENIAGRRMFFGVEIETYGAERSTVKAIVQSALRAAGFSEKRIREWKIISDGSISSSAGSAEIASGKLGWNDKDLTALERVCNDLRAYGIRSDANHTCGLHIHIGAHHLDGAQIAGVAKLWMQNEDALISEYQSRDRTRYCYKLESTFRYWLQDLRHQPTIDEINCAWYGTMRPYRSRDKYQDTRYHTMNLHSLFFRGTIEFRLFDGTIDAKEIAKRVALCRSIVQDGADQAEFALAA